MPQSDFKVSAIVPSIRRDDLEELLLSMCKQSLQFHEAVVVDTTVGGESESLATKLLTVAPFKITYLKHPRMGTCSSRNIAVAESSGSWLYFLDDDMWLGPNHLRECFEMIAANDIGALSPLGKDAVPSGVTPWRIVKAVFSMDNLRPGRLLPSGFRTELAASNVPRLAQWLQGGNAIVRKDLTYGLAFDETLEHLPYAVSEDIDYFYRMSERVALYSAAVGEVIHKKTPTGRLGQDDFYYAFVLNHWHLSRKHFPSPVSRLACLWALVGTGLFLLSMLVTSPRESQLSSWQGYVRGMRRLFGWPRSGHARTPN